MDLLHRPEDPRSRVIIIVAAAAALVVLLAIAIGADSGGGEQRATAAATTTTGDARAGDGSALGGPDTPGEPGEGDEPGDPPGETGSGQVGSGTTDGPGTGASSTTWPSVPLPDENEPPPPLQVAYVAGFEDGCRAIWALSPNGQMYDPGWPDVMLTVDDCYDEVSAEFGEMYANAAAARAAGYEDAGDFAALMSSESILCWSEEGCWDNSTW
jgi:hypothetical protein